MVRCAVKNCQNYSGKKGKKLKFFRFPREKRLLRKWIIACRLRTEDVSAKRICSDHFTDNDYCLNDRLFNTPFEQKRLELGVVPTVNLYNPLKFGDNRVKCDVIGCNSKLGDENFTFYRLPQCDSVVRDKWISVCHLNKDDFEELANFRICSKHFNAEDYLSVDDVLNVRERRLKEDAVPTNFIDCEMKADDTVETNEDEVTAERLKHFNANMSNVRERRLKEDAIPTNFIDCEMKADDTVETNEDEVTTEEVNKLALELDAEDEECIRKLEKENAELEAKIEYATKVYEKYDNFVKNASKIFTKGQMKRLQLQRRCLHEPQDKALAMKIHSFSSRGYKFLISLGYPLPKGSSLRKRELNLISSGILTNVINLIKGYQLKSIQQKLFVLSINQIRVKSFSCNDSLTQVTSIEKQTKLVHMIMLKNLQDKWIQPIYYDYTDTIKSDVLIDIIRKLYDINLTVIAVICDFNQIDNIKNLFYELNVNEQDNIPYFHHPNDINKKIFIFIDVKILIELLQNFLSNTTFVINDTIINYDLIKTLTKFKTITDIFSYKTIDLMKNQISCIDDVELMNFIQIFTDWFNIFNLEKILSSLPTTSASTSSLIELRPSQQPFGAQLNEQIQILDKVTELLNTITNYNHIKDDDNSYLFNGFLLNNCALLQLHEYLKDNYKIDSIKTSKLNIINIQNHFKMYPSESEFRNGLKSFVLDGMKRKSKRF